MSESIYPIEIAVQVAWWDLKREVEYAKDMLRKDEEETLMWHHYEYDVLIHEKSRLADKMHALRRLAVPI